MKKITEEQALIEVLSKLDLDKEDIVGIFLMLNHYKINIIEFLTKLKDYNPNELDCGKLIEIIEKLKNESNNKD